MHYVQGLYFAQHAPAIQAPTVRTGRIGVTCQLSVPAVGFRMKTLDQRRGVPNMGAHGKGGVAQSQTARIASNPNNLTEGSK